MTTHEILVNVRDWFWEIAYGETDPRRLRLLLRGARRLDKATGAPFVRWGG